MSRNSKTVGAPSLTVSGDGASGDGTPRVGISRWGTTLFAVVLFIIILAGFTSYIENWLWMSEVGFIGIFWTMLSVKWVMFGAAFGVVFLYLWLNLRQAMIYCNTTLDADRSPDAAYLKLTDATIPTKTTLPLRLMKASIILFSAGIGLFVALGFYTEWDTYLRFRYGGAFGVADPLFGVDVGFYIFHLPFYELLQNSFTMLTLAAIAMVIAVYGLFAPRLRSSAMISVGRGAEVHLTVLLFLLVANFGWGFYLDHYELLYSTQGVVYGAGYTADHVTRVALWWMVGASAVACAILVYNVFRPRLMALAVGAGIYAVLWIVGVAVAPLDLPKIHRATERTGIGDTVSETFH